MPAASSPTFERLIETLRAMGPEALERVSDSEEYRTFIRDFPLEKLPRLTLQEYCLGTGRDGSFCWWLERGLEPVMGRYMPGTARGHIVYWDGQHQSLYKNRRLTDLSDTEAVSYTTKVQHAIASCPLDQLASLDDDATIYSRAGVEPRVTVGKGRKLRLLACYHPEDLVLIASADHVIHFLRALGLPDSEIPAKSKAVAGMLVLREFFLRAKELVPGLTTRGFMRGLYDPQLNIAPPPRKEWDSDVEADDAPAGAYLLTWNPENFNIGGDAEPALDEEQRWTCHSTQPQLGDIVWLVRLGQEPKGIVMRGVVTRPSEEAPHWKDATKTARYIHFRVQEWRPTPATGLVPMALLNAAAPKQRWSPQISGVGIAEPASSILQRLWDESREVHSLRQFVNWLTANPTSVHKDWLARYRDTVALASRLRSGTSQPDSQALRRLWSAKSNGIAEVGPGTLSQTEFDANEPLLLELTRMVLARADADAYRAVVTRWKTAVHEGTLAKVNWAVIGRLFAAAAPEAFTTIVSAPVCQRLLTVLRDQFQLDPPASDESDWPALNASIVACMRKAGLEPQRALENNVAMWELVKDRGDAPTQEAQADRQDVHSQSAQVQSKLLAPPEPRNIVLYGPPGTGKTWSTVRHAIAVVAPEMLEGAAEDELLKARFDEFVESGQVVFTTFHQSYSYEDFVEGLRAVTQQGALHYSVEPGVFKRLCDRARQGLTEAEDPFDKSLLSLRAKIDEAPNRRVSMKTSRGKAFEATYEGGDTFRVFPASSSELGPAGYTASMRQVRDLYVHGDEQGMYNTSYVRGMLDYLQRECQLPSAAVAAQGIGPPKPFVLVIDEINRGNISRIFGELITLIEPSKRAGLADQLTVTLPYSKEPFTVPANVHIVATMNTADRSLTGLDIALRRRFEFIEMPPRPDHLANIAVGELSLARLLSVMNQRIELLLDRDHCLGHAMFLPLEREPKLHRLKEIFRRRVLPLLQEYFFDDWERIQWVLNDHRKPASLRFVCKPQVDIGKLLGENVPVSEQKLWTINEEAFDSLDAYLGIVDAKGELAG